MKILQIISSVNPDAGGPVEGLKHLGAALCSKGHAVDVVSLDPPEADFVRKFPLPVHPMGPVGSKYAYSSKLVPWLRANRSEYDAVIVNGIWQYHSFGTWRALRDSDTPYVVFTHGMLDPWFKKQYPLKHLKKWAYWPWAEYRVLRDAQAVLFTCEEERVLARSSFWLYRSHEVVVSYGTAKPGGDPQNELRQFFARFPELAGKHLLLFMGRIHPKKGCDLLIDAFAKEFGTASEWQLVMAGPDQTGWQKDLESQTRNLGIESRVTWTGMLHGSEKWGALRAAEAFVLPSHQENFGVAVVEAMAVGLPVLISNKVNIWREIESDGAGLVAEDSLEGTRDALKAFLHMDDAKRAAMRAAASACFDRRFEIKRSAELLHAALVNTTGMN